ncbi:MAG: hypothetical protein Q4F53_03050 [Nesterenkonia sp.]|uniref:hypothetical protein n=1 Tax=Nesterenkonia marinintestina TaxID=2979865 RepID=UPI0021C1750D|nr:hypothetical protein [Nesterenkonia sp. GX14115]MDO5492575.1 hypothetical protein [Nesterenkonia sp.]
MGLDRLWPTERTPATIGQGESAVRWDALFADLQAQWEAEASAELDREIAEAVRVEQSTVRLIDRLRGHRDVTLGFRLLSGGHVAMAPQLVGEDWVAGTEAGAGIVLPASSIAVVDGLGRRASTEPSRARRGLGIGTVLRALSRDRAVITVQGADGSQLAQGLSAGVGRDHLEVLPTHGGEVPRSRSMQAVRAIPFSALGLVRADVAARI